VPEIRTPARPTTPAFSNPGSGIGRGTRPTQAIANECMSGAERGRVGADAISTCYVPRGKRDDGALLAKNFGPVDETVSLVRALFCSSIAIFPSERELCSPRAN